MGRSSGGKGLINSAYDLGGAPLLVKTVQELGGLEIHYPTVIDFAGLRAITDAVGGVDVQLTAPVKDGRTKHVFRAGEVHLDGRTAEIFVRQRYFTDPNSAAKNRRTAPTTCVRAGSRSTCGRSPTRSSPPARPGSRGCSPPSLSRSRSTGRCRCRTWRSSAPGSAPATSSSTRCRTGPSSSAPARGGSTSSSRAASDLFATIREGTMDRYVLSHPPENATRGR